MAWAKSIAQVWDDTDVLKEVPINGNSVVSCNLGQELRGLLGGQGKVQFLPSFPTGLVTGSVPSRGLSQTSGTITMLILRPFITLAHTPRHVSFSAVYSEVSLTPTFCYVALASSCLH